MKKLVILNNVRKFRRELDMTQQELADKALVHRQTITSIEGQSYMPSIAVAYSISIALGKDLAEVFYIEGKE